MARAHRLTATGALLTAAALALPATAGATWAGSSASISYGVFRAAGYKIHTAGPHGAHDRVLVKGAQDPEWSRGGGRIAFVTKRGLERMHADRTHRAVVVPKSKLGDV